MRKIINNKKFKNQIFIFISFLFTIVIHPLNAQEVIKIGGLSTRVGALSDIGKSQELGAELAIEEINKANGILGKKIEIIWRDTQIKPDIALREAKALIFDKKVDFLLGCFLTSEGQAVSNFANEVKKIFLTHVMASFLTEENFHPYFFRYNVSSHMMSKAQVINMKGRGIKNIYFIAPDYAYGHATVKEVKELINKYLPEIKVIGEEWPPLGEKDYTPYIRKIISLKPDCLYSVLFGGDQITFIRQAKALGFFEKVKYAGGDFAPESIRPLGLELPEGLFGASFYEFHTPNIEQNKIFVKKFLEKYKEYPGYQAALAYTGIYALKKAIENVKSIDTEKVINGLESIKFDSPLGENLYFRKIDHQLSRPLVVGQTSKYKDMKWLVINHNPKLIPAEDLWRSEEEIKEIRLRKK